MGKHMNEPRLSVCCAICNQAREMRVSLVRPCDYYICHTCIKRGRHIEKPVGQGFTRTMYSDAATNFNGYIEIPYRDKVDLSQYEPYD